MTKPSAPYRLKIERAYRHIQELETAINTFFDGNPYTAVLEKKADPPQRIYRVKINQCIPDEWSAILGDAIHNIRSGLDLVAVEIVRHDDPSRVSYNHVHFPIRESEERFVEALPVKMKGASARSLAIIARLKPYKGGTEAFYRLHQIDIVDKHKAIIPVGAAHTLIEYAIDPKKFMPHWDWGDIKPLAMPSTPANSQFPLKDGAVLGYFNDMEEIMHDEVKFAFDIAFGEGQFFDGESILPTLKQMIEFVERVVTIFERHILSK